MLTSLVLLLLSIVVAAGAGYFWGSRGSRFAQSELAALKERVAAADARATESATNGSRLSTQLENERAAMLTLRGSLSTAESLNTRIPGLEAEVSRLRIEADVARQNEASIRATLLTEKVAAEDKLLLLRNAEEQMKNTFAALSTAALNSNSDSFLRLGNELLAKYSEGASRDFAARQKAIDEIVKPVGTTLEKMEIALTQVQHDRVDADAAIRQQFQMMAESHTQLRGETSNLVRALRTPHVSGRWGEIQLKRVVEIAGMLPYCDFEEQPQTEDGKRPDLRVNLPGGKLIVVDAKTPMPAYLTATETDNDQIRAEALAAHARVVRDHITKLSSKAYWEQFPATPEFVVMFLPGESFFSTALKEDPSLIEYGVEQRVIPASPTTLIALLRAVAYGWRQEQIAESALKISKLGRELYERLGSVINHFAELGDNLNKSVGAYNKAVASIESRLVVTARKLREMSLSDKEIDELPRVEIMSREFESPDLLPPQQSLIEPVLPRDEIIE